LSWTTLTIGAAVAKKAEDKRVTVYRSSEDGQWVTKKHAEKNPDTTEKERVRKPPPKKPKKG
jgi:hypothetical protein